MKRLSLFLAVALAAVTALATVATGANAGSVEVSMTETAFVPKDATLTAGDTVVWKNPSSLAHTVTADDGSFDTVIDPGETFQRTFSTAGDVPYYCRFHGSPGKGMSGTLRVGSQTSGSGRTGTRIAGPGRIETAVQVSRYQFPNGATEVYLAKSDLNPDALVGGSLTRGPILLVPACGDLPQVVADEIDRLGAKRVVALGGTAAVCDAILQQAAAS